MKNKKMMFCVISILVLALTVSAIVYATSDNKGALLGQIFKQYKVDQRGSGGKVYESEDITITEDEIQYYKAMYSLDGVSKSDEEIKKKLIKDRLLLKEAEKAGVTLTDEEVKYNMEQTREGLHKSDETLFISFLENAGMTEEEYWEKAFPVYKKAYIIGKYKKFYLKEKFRENNASLKDEDFNTEFAEYYSQYCEELYQEYIKTHP